MRDKKPKYIEGKGWRYDTEHSMKRRHRKNHYNEVGTYLVTIVVENRNPVFGFIEGNIKARSTDRDYPAIVLSPLGERVVKEEMPKIHAIYPMVEIWHPICIMPDHIHLIIRINATLPHKKHLGTIIGAFKGGISRAWGGGTLFEDNYNDRILMRDGQLKNWKAYLKANPYRWLVMHTHPELMQRALCIVIDGVRYGAFGNFMLLRHPEKEQVFFHRKMEDDRLMPDTHGLIIPTEQTLFWQKEHERLMEMAMLGNVLVTPGISECEKCIKNECLENHYNLIHIQAEPIGEYWKPERSRFESCAVGKLLILAPWAEDQRGDTDYERFHNLNTLAASICKLDEVTAMQITAG